ncbi:MAG: Rpn family recombination-promoting nuclease/putative transposase [Alkalispirochaeta sp.]
MEIHRVHDRFFRSFFSQPVHLRGLIRTSVPADVVAMLDLASLKVEPGTWIDKRNREHLSDLAVSVEVVGHDGNDDGRTADDIREVEYSEPRSSTAKIYILVEHKSYRDPAALLQLLRYMVQVWTAEVRSGGAPPLTPIIPVLVYHGPAGAPRRR